ncbi:MAG: twin-arginine translocase TatA/TatE family subunit [Micrococcaceae bacterium]
MNIFGINGGELIVLIVLALLLLGPEKIPEYTRALGDWVRKLRRMAEGAKEQFKEETGTDFDEVDWQRYDPRQYDPRRIIRDALAEPLDDLKQVAGVPTTERAALRQDLKNLDPREAFRSSTTTGRTADPNAAPEENPEDAETEQSEAEETLPAPFDSEAT